VEEGVLKEMIHRIISFEERVLWLFLFSFHLKTPDFQLCFYEEKKCVSGSRLHMTGIQTVPIAGCRMILSISPYQCCKRQRSRTWTLNSDIKSIPIQE
jgi:hypothetical protein